MNNTKILAAAAAAHRATVPAEFAERIPLQPWLFPAAGLIALALALISVGTLAYLVARQKPVHALRYE